MTDDERRSTDRRPHAPRAPAAALPDASRSVEDAVATARTALASAQAAVRSTRDAVKDTREAIARTKLAVTQSVAELRRAAELSARESAGERLSRAESRVLTRERLLDAAADVFNRLGYHGASLEAVAEAAGYTKGAVYSNFATKGDLFLALHRRYTARQITEQSATLATLSLEELAERGGASLVEQARSQETWDLLQIEFWLAGMRDPELRAAMARDNEELWEELGTRFGEKLASAGVQGFTGLEFAKLVNALGSGLLLQLYIDPGFVDRGLFARAIRALLGLPAVQPAPADPNSAA
jgi:AcrR family transcriptional regulator